jgi:eukaryotic translation initiation factor 2C
VAADVVTSVVVEEEENFAAAAVEVGEVVMLAADSEEFIGMFDTFTHSPQFDSIRCFTRSVLSKACSFIMPSDHSLYSEGYPVATPDQNITEFENATVNDPANIPGAMTLDQTLPRRPAYGTEGRAVTLHSNYFIMNLKNKNQLVHRYDVNVEPSVGLSLKKKRRYFELLLEQAVLKDEDVATDYSTILITNSKLQLTNNEMSFETVIHDKLEAVFPAAVSGENPERQAARKRRTRTLKIRHSNMYSIAELYSYVNSEHQSETYAAKGDLIQALNIIFCRAANSQSTITNVGQNKFYPFSDQLVTHSNTESMDLGDGLIALRGYFSSVRPASQRILVNLNVSNGAFYKPGPISTLMDAFMRTRNRNDTLSLRELSMFIKGLRVITQYNKKMDSNGVEKSVLKVESVLGLATSPRLGANCLDLTFLWKNSSGSLVTSNVEQYFKQSLRPPTRDLS